MDEQVLAREKRREKIRKRKRRKLLVILAIAFVFVLLITLPILTVRAIRRANRPEMQQIGPAVPVDTDTIAPLRILYDYAQPVPESDAAPANRFANTLFIGDARLQGFQLYNLLTESDFYTSGTISVDSALSDLTNGGELSALLSQNNYSAIYLSLGVNELGWNDGSSFGYLYGQLVDALRQRQLNAVIYLHLIIPVSQAKSGNPSYISNERIESYNAMIRAIALEKSVYYLDASPVLCNENGYLISELNSDGLHLLKAGIEIWYEYLSTHIVEKGNYAN